MDGRKSHRSQHTTFLGLSFHSLLTILQLVRLRLAWIDSAKAMNSVKDYYISHLQNFGH